MDVTIIIPTFNRLWSLPKAIESCKETKCATEIIVVDDGSTDGTSEWLLTQTGIFTIFQSNQGKDWAVNNGFKIARGKYIKFLDSDDYYPVNSIDNQFSLAEKTNADIVVAGFKVVNENGDTEFENLVLETDDFIAQQLGETNGSHYSAFLFKKEFIKSIPHRQEFGSVDDRKFILEVALKNPKIVFLNESGLFHLKHNNEKLQGLSGIKLLMNHWHLLTIYRQTISELEKTDSLTERRKKAAINVLWPLSRWIAKENINEASNLYYWIMQLQPEFIIPEKGSIGFLYKKMGFINTEKMLKMRRILKYGF